MLTIQEINKITTCEELFVNNKEKTKGIYRELAKKYHPDVYKGSDAESNFTKINTLYNQALEKIEKGIWEEKDVIVLNSFLGKKYKFKYLREHLFELGKFYIGRNHIIYILDKKNKKYYDNAIKVLSDLKYANKAMEDEFKRYFPTIIDKFELKTGEYCLVVKKESTDFLLQDFNDMFKKNGTFIDSKHTAWILSRLNNIACFLQYNNLVHNGISLSNCFISPKYHTIMLFGGWWYCVPVGEKMLGTQKCIFNIMPIKEKNEKIASFKTDMESIRQLGRQLNSTSLPIDITTWLEKASDLNAFKEFESWNQVLEKSWGPRKFIVLEVSEKDIYSN